MVLLDSAIQPKISKICCRVKCSPLFLNAEMRFSSEPTVRFISFSSGRPRNSHVKSRNQVSRKSSSKRHSSFLDLAQVSQVRSISSSVAAEKVVSQRMAVCWTVSISSRRSARFPFTLPILKALSN